MDIYNIIIWVTIFFIILNINGRKERYRAKEEKIKTVLIILTGYYIMYFFLGLKFGFSNSPYSLKISEIVKNLTYILGLKLIQEYVKTRLLELKRNKLSYVIVTVIFAIISIEFKKLNTSEEIIKFVMAEVFPKFAEATLLTFLSLNGGFLLAFAYIIPNELVKILTPIFPNLDWFIESVLKYAMFILIFLFINYESTLKIRKKSKREIRKETPLKNLPIIIITVLIASFVIGLFPYKPVAIISNSMYPEFSRGSAVIIKKFDNQEIKIGDVIEYELNGRLILHRVIGIQRGILENEYITKGDNNKEHDLLPVKEEQIKGIVKYKIPILGYPSVLFSELFLLNK